MTRLGLAAVALLLSSCASQLPQAPPSGIAADVRSPDVRAGSFWRYSVVDGFTRIPRAPMEYRVAGIEGDVVRVSVASGSREATELYTREWNWVERPATNMQVFSYSPPYRAFDFPLAAGKKWKYQGRATDPATGQSFPVQVEGDVLGWERVRVPDGEFDALKVRRFVFLGYRDAWRGQSVIIEHDWYAPALNQVVRRETTSKYMRIADAHPSFLRVRGGGGGRSDGASVPRMEQDDWLIYELTEHGPK